MPIMRLGYVHIRVTDLDDATRHYTKTLGMQQTAADGNRRYFKAWDEFDHHSVVVEEGGVGLVKLGMKAASSADLELFERNLGAFGVVRYPSKKFSPFVLAGVGTYIICLIVQKTVGLRISKADELAGLDHTQHRESGYGLINLN